MFAASNSNSQSDDEDNDDQFFTLPESDFGQLMKKKYPAWVMKHVVSTTPTRTLGSMIFPASNATFINSMGVILSCSSLLASTNSS